jgi:hypothetical protein
VLRAKKRSEVESPQEYQEQQERGGAEGVQPVGADKAS